MRWYATLGAFYGIHLAVLFYVAMVLREFVSLDVFSPGWVSVRLLAWLSAVTAAVAALLMWLNLRGLPAVFDEAASHRFAIGAAATAASAVVLLGIAVAHYSFGRRGSRVGAALLVIAMIGSLALPLAARGLGGQTPPGTQRDGRVAGAAQPQCSSGHAAGPRRRVARVHLAPRGGGTAAELRSAPRWWRIARSRDNPADATRPGLGRRCDRHVSRQERRALRDVVLRQRRRSCRSICCRIIASRRRWCVLASFATSRNRRRRGVRRPSGTCSTTTASAAAWSAGP